MSKYLYTAIDIAIYFYSIDFKHSDKNKVMELLWEEKDTLLEVKYRKDKVFFFKSVNREMERYLLDSDDKETNAINKILEDIGSSFTINTLYFEQNVIEAFFRVIKLKLTYTEDTNNIKMKLRTLLRYFGYLRRSQQFVDNVKRTLRSLGLVTYLKGYELCDVSIIKLDDMMMIRLK
ncbi:hypothetical protein KPL47_08975 [Clostridium estertheticum]|uniref:hypothetical protein n=1 Tax=Clostridium estertheticum TaxID=238834 RepID=UPI001C0E6B65|nr:hypothetical protein [Clostridium estertheticum]MBU3176505.1 hypothetical protein [Clostridium estertheticum]